MIVMMEAFFPENKRPSRSIVYKITGPFFTFLVVILVLLLWILAGVFLIATTVGSDFCVEADLNMLDNAPSSEYLDYYVC